MPNIRTLADLIAAGAQYTAEAVVRRGGGVAEVYRALRARFGIDLFTNLPSVTALTSRAERSVAAARAITEGERVPAGSIPSVPGSTGRYCYRVVVTGGIGTQVTRQIVEVSSDSPMSLAEIRDAAELAAREGRGADYLPAIFHIAGSVGQLGTVTAGQVISTYRC